MFSDNSLHSDISPITVQSNSEHVLDATSISVKIQEYEGPLAMLLSLVRQHKIDIYDIPIAHITKQYLKELNETLVHTLENLTSFYKMATWLIHIKSHMLLPVDTRIDEEEIDDPRAELVQTLIEYSRYKKLSYLLEKNHTECSYDIHRSTESEIIFEIPKEEMWKEVDAMKLLSTFMHLFNRTKDSNLERVINLHDPVTVREKIAFILEQLEKQETCSFHELIQNQGILSLVCSFLAVLELMKQQKIKVFQNMHNDDIIIHKR